VPPCPVGDDCNRNAFSEADQRRRIFVGSDATRLSDAADDRIDAGELELCGVG
jgi:hypothetical protein